MTTEEMRHLLAPMEDRDDIQTPQSKLSDQLFSRDSPNALKYKFDALIMKLLMLVKRKRTKRIWTYFTMIPMVRLHMMSYKELFSFLQNPTQKWNQLTIKPSEI